VKEIEKQAVRELLGAYYQASRSAIMDRSTDIDSDIAKLEERCEEYRSRIPEVFEQ